MTIDEAISEFKERAEDSKKISELGMKSYIPKEKEEKQLAKWLEELKLLKDDYAKGMQSSYATFMYNKAIDDFVEHITLPVTTEEQISEIVEQLKFTKGVENMNELIKRQDAINAVMQNYCYESDRLTALQSIPVTTEEKIRNKAIINYAVAVLAEVVENAKQEDAPIYLGDEEVDQWVRLSDVQTAINKYLN